MQSNKDTRTAYKKFGLINAKVRFTLDEILMPFAISLDLNVTVEFLNLHKARGSKAQGSKYKA